MKIEERLDEAFSVLYELDRGFFFDPIRNLDTKEKLVERLFDIEKEVCAYVNKRAEDHGWGGIPVKAKQWFYYRGCFYDKEEDFNNAVRNYAVSPLSRESFDDLIKKFANDLWVNYEMGDNQLTNNRFEEILSNLMTDCVLNIRKENPYHGGIYENRVEKY